MIYQRRLTPVQVARELRKKVTTAEKILWKELRNRQLGGYKFLRQHPVVYDIGETPVNFYVLDFYCDSAKTAIELDGDIHNEQLNYDRKRENDLHWLGIKVLRIKNAELADIENIKLRILDFLEN